MVPTTRRRLLRATAAGLSALAGCGETARDDPPTPGERRPENVALDPETEVLRRSAAKPAAWLRRPDATTGGDATGPPPDARLRGFVASTDAADRLEFADVTGVDAAAARRFVAATQFDRETLYLDAPSVRACFRLELCYVAWSATEVDTSFGSYYRDADVACETGNRDRTAWLIRIPDRVDPDSVRRYGSAWSSNGCAEPPWRERAGGATTDGEGGE